jgi:uncharacterized protein YbjT (DUF2867 family)
VRILLTGATGYLGGRLAPRLIEQGHQIRCVTRDPSRLRDVPWAPDVEVVRGDALDAGSMRRALTGIDCAYYLVHSIDTGDDFGDTDRRAANTFAEAARARGVRRLVYLGGLVPADARASGTLSAHLASRDEVGRILGSVGVPTAVLRAAVIIGSGGASFEMLRYLTERLPVMVTPRWVHTRIQPIAVQDVLRYLAGCATLPESVSRGFDVGGPDVLTYAQMMQRFAAVAGLPRRRIISLPVLTPGLSSHWVGLVTPVPAKIARPLVSSLRHEVVCSEHEIARWVPDPGGGLIGFDEAVRLALRRVADHDVATRWSAAARPGAPSDRMPSGPLLAGSAPTGSRTREPVRDGRLSSDPLPSDPLPSDPPWAGGSLRRDERAAPVRASREALWAVIEGIGGDNGWYSWPLAWSARGWLDLAVGGVGLRRGRRDPRSLQVGEAVDFWRVDDLIPGELLRLRAEMKLPGRAWLELAVEEGPEGGTWFRQRALFWPKGLAGQAYWWAISPFHGIVFGGMLRNIVRTAERTAERT